MEYRNKNNSRLYKDFSSRIFLLISLFCSLLSFAQTESEQSHPNIILIMADDLGWGDVGFNGNSSIKTPHLDNLASKGVVFDRFYAAAPVCSPTRASVLTGRNPYRQGIYTANTGFLKKQETTLAELLKIKNYSTGIFGKWHLGTLTTLENDANRGRVGNTKEYSTPDMHGFDAYTVTESKVPTYDPMVKPIQFDTIKGESLRYGWSAINKEERKVSYGTSYWSGKETKVSEAYLKGENTKIIMDRAIPFMKKAIQSKQPFFTVIWIHTPHLPVVSDDHFKSIYKNFSHEEQLYFGSITAMDEQIGRLHEFLIQQGISENTMIWFASDNGPELRTPGSAYKFRGKKRDLYEGGLRVPAFLVWPERIVNGYRSNMPVVTSDYLPSIAEVLNLPLKAHVPIDGLAIFDKLIKKDSLRNQPIGFQAPGRMSWVGDSYKLVKNNRDQDFELYNLINDPYEKNNIISTHIALAKKMQIDLENWIKSCKESNQGLDYKQ